MVLNHSKLIYMILRNAFGNTRPGTPGLGTPELDSGNTRSDRSPGGGVCGPAPAGAGKGAAGACCPLGDVNIGVC